MELATGDPRLMRRSLAGLYKVSEISRPGALSVEGDPDELLSAGQTD